MLQAVGCSRALKTEAKRGWLFFSQRTSRQIADLPPQHARMFTAGLCHYRADIDFGYLSALDSSSSLLLGRVLLAGGAEPVVRTSMFGCEVAFVWC